MLTGSCANSRSYCLWNLKSVTRSSRRKQRRNGQNIGSPKPSVTMCIDYAFVYERPPQTRRVTLLEDSVGCWRYREANNTPGVRDSVAIRKNARVVLSRQAVRTNTTAEPVVSPRHTFYQGARKRISEIEASRRIVTRRTSLLCFSAPVTEQTHPYCAAYSRSCHCLPDLYPTSAIHRKETCAPLQRQ